MSEKDKRRLILDAAIELIREKGFDNTRIIDIANRAGIGKGTVYDYFDSKEALLLATVQDVVEEDFQGVFGHIQEEWSVREKLRGFLRIHRVILDKYGPYMILFFEQQLKEPEHRSTEFVEEIRQIRSVHQKRLSDIVEEGIRSGEIRKDLPPQELVSFVMAMAENFSFSYFSQHYDGEMDEPVGAVGVGQMEIEKLVELMVNGVGAPKEVACEQDA